MHLRIISLKGVEFEGDIVSLNLKTGNGEITVLDNHRPLITSLVSGKATIVRQDKTKFIHNIESGFLEVGPGNRVSLLAS